MFVYTNFMPAGPGNKPGHLDRLTLKAALLLLGRGGGDASFPHDKASIDRELARLRNAVPLTPPRPLVILNGYHTPAHVARWAAARIAELTDHQYGDILTVSYPTCSLIEQAAERAIDAVTDRFGTQDVDVVGISMGGLVARYASLAPDRRVHPLRQTTPGSTRLNIARLFSFATPHMGSKRAALVAPDDAARDMKPGSPFLAMLNAHAADYPIVCYAHRGDNLVDPHAAAAPGSKPIVADGSRWMSHFTAIHNPWFLADLARRLRGLTPLHNHS